MTARRKVEIWICVRIENKGRLLQRGKGLTVVVDEEFAARGLRQLTASASVGAKLKAKIVCARRRLIR